MKRLLTLATTAMFTTGLAVLPVTVFAQASAPVGADAKAGTSSRSVTNDAKVTPANKDSAAMGNKDSTAMGNKDSTATKDSAKVTGPKVGTAPTGGAAKATGNHDKGA
jgi:hypothetical protein